MTQDPTLTPWVLLTATAALLAFLVSICTLIARERKMPYLINSIFGVFIVCILGAIADIGAVLANNWRDELLQIGLWSFLWALILTGWRLWTIWVRFSQFIDPGSVKAHLYRLTLRKIKYWWRTRKQEPSYEHNPEPLSKDLLSKIEGIVTAHCKSDHTDNNKTNQEKKKFEIRKSSETRSLAMALRHQSQANKVLGELCSTFLQSGLYVQYLTASRHPIEFIEYLKGIYPSDKWQEARSRIIVIDAYTPHFGFADSINPEKTAQLRKFFGVVNFLSSKTYAGLHTASAQAFNWIKNKSAEEVRTPALIIYEDCYALTDIESVEQYRIFVRHVLPSERLWDGMFSVFTETAQSDPDWKLLNSYASIVLDLREDKGGT